MKTPEAEPNVSISVTVPLSIYATIKRMSKVQRRSMNDLMRFALKEWLEANNVEHYRIISESELALLKEKIRREMAESPREKSRAETAAEFKKKEIALF